jgi:uncharacterized protein DUF6572
VTDEPAGILNPAAIDRVTVGEDGVVELHVEQTAPWDASDHLLLLTQEKLWNYMAYVADGNLERSVTPETSSQAARHAAAASSQAAREAPATSRTRRRQERSDARSRAMRWRVVVDLLDEPDERTADLLRRAGEQFHRLGGTLLTRRMPADR